MTDRAKPGKATDTDQAAGFTMRLLWAIILVPVLVLLFGWITKGVMANEFRSIDYKVTHNLREWASPGLTKAVTWITHLATSTVIIPLSLALSAWFAFLLRLRIQALMLLITLTGSYLLNEIMKSVLQRTRPEWEHWVAATGYSFPSGHAMAATSFYGMLAYILYRLMKSKGLRVWFIPIAASALILSIGLSRVYLGVHYITDVIAGFIAGGLWLIACIYALSRLCQNPVDSFQTK